MPFLAILIGLTVTSVTICGIAFGVVAGRSSLFWLSEQPIVGALVSWLLDVTKVMQFGDGVFGNLLCFGFLLILMSCLSGLVMWALIVVEQLLDTLQKPRTVKTARSRKPTNVKT